MKKILVALLALITVFAFGACGNAGTQEEAAEDTQTEEAAEKTIGMLAFCNLDADEVGEYFSETNGKTTITDIYYDSLDALEMALTSGKIDQADIGESTGRYMLSKNPDLEEGVITVVPTNNYGMLLMADNKELCDDISEAIEELEAEGTLAELQKTYIDGYIDGSEPEAIELPVFEDTDDTITIAVSGDLPPMDFIGADGTPAGFNVALISAIAQKLEVNVKLTTVNAGSRAVALTSGKVDVVFWTVSSELKDQGMGNPLVDADMPENTVKTTPYYSEQVMGIVLK